MARKTLRYTVPDEGRDRGKVFVITEMPASQAEKWAIRAFMAAAATGAEIPDDLAAMGMAGLFRLGSEALSKIPFEQAEPLLDEMMGCVQIAPNPGNPSVVRGLIEDDIEEIATRVRLRTQILQLHVGFSAAGATSI